MKTLRNISLCLFAALVALLLWPAAALVIVTSALVALVAELFMSKQR